MLTTLAVANYRSIRKMVLPLGGLNLITGANGSGKSNLYRALRLLAGTARGGLIATLAREGGLESTLWAGPETLSRGMKSGAVPVQGGPRREPVHLRLGFCDEDVQYATRLYQAGVPTELHVYPGAPHGFDRSAPESEIGRRCLRDVKEWLAPALGKPR